MKAIVFEGPDLGLKLKELPRPQVQDGDLLIKVDLCGICASDLMALRGDATDYSPPLVMGHELAGVVCESRNPKFKGGEKVTVNPMISCGCCYYCSKDLGKYCSKLYGVGHDIDGGYAEYMRIPKQLVDTDGVIQVPNEVLAEELMFVEPLGCCLNALRETDLKESAAIIGSGPIGLLMLQLLKERSLQTIVVEPIGSRREFAKALGADIAVEPHSNLVEEIRSLTHGGVDTVIFSTNAVSALKTAFKLVKRGGFINLFGLIPKGMKLDIDIEQLHFMGYKITASWAFSKWSLLEAKEKVISHQLSLKPLITHKFPLEEGLKGFEMAARHEGIKIVLEGGGRRVK